MRSRFWRGWRGKEAARFCSAECETPRKHPPPPRDTYMWVWNPGNLGFRQFWVGTKKRVRCPRRNGEDPNVERTEAGE